MPTLMLDLEEARLAALHEYALLDSPADAELTAVVRIAATIADVPTATLNLIDESRQCQLTTVGFEGSTTRRSDSMCAIAFRGGRIAHVPDASRHPIYAGNPWVDGRIGAVRFYASVPLVTPSGYALGTLCVFDTVAKTLTETQLGRLEDLARVLVGLFERRRQTRIAEQATATAERDRRRLELAHAELRRSNEELEGFAAAISNDLVRPLASTSGYLELIDQLYGDRLDERAAGWLTGASESMERMRQLIEALLTYAKAGNAPCVRSAVTLAEATTAATADLRTLIESHGAEVRVRGNVELSADPTLLRQLLQNLIDNAVTYHHPERAPRVEIAGRHADGGHLITVTDNGIGIPAAERDRVFDMFTQVDPAGRRGHGVGLSTCARIVERHHGTITVDEAPDGGTVISLWLPGAVAALSQRRDRAASIR
ncbi:ATP-binding protein [Actinoplanes missouriensis]|uniref:GAF domain-containing sensor histidine kinase n=1 Tax=Actinoplanes missouriensis TaxID=1866 RepID=UPI0033F2DDA9